VLLARLRRPLRWQLAARPQPGDAAVLDHQSRIFDQAIRRAGRHGRDVAVHQEWQDESAC